MKAYSYSEARQQLAEVLNRARPTRRTRLFGLRVAMVSALGS